MTEQQVLCLVHESTPAITDPVKEGETFQQAEHIFGFIRDSVLVGSKKRQTYWDKASYKLIRFLFCYSLLLYLTVDGDVMFFVLFFYGSFLIWVVSLLSIVPVCPLC